MRRVDPDFVPEGSLAVLTARHVGPEVHDGPVFMADFQDLHGLSWKGHLLGIDGSGHVRFGRRPLRMEAGVWIMPPDTASQSRHKDVLIPPHELELVLIP
jgi:hypothetical protein